MANLDIETALQAGRPGLIIAGVDEVGRGPWAGPVVAAAVILPEGFAAAGLTDSKKMTAAARQRAAAEVHASAEVGIGAASVEEIDQINILKATHLAMVRALAALPNVPGYALIDGNRIPPDIPCPAEAIVKGDGKSLSIAAASVVAKVHRDTLMAELSQMWPGYGWESNAGYGTKSHQEGLATLGVTPHHRRSFKPIHNILCEEKSVSR